MAIYVLVYVPLISYISVQVTSVTLKRGPILIVKNLTATAGTFLTLTCEPGISRPAPTILWYIGDTLKQSSNSIQYRLNAVNDDHGEVIYCKAYNLQSASQAVTSTTPRLYVRGKNSYKLSGAIV